MEKRQSQKQITDKKYRETHKDAIASYLKEWRLNNKKYTKEYRLKNRTKIYQQNKEWQQKNREKHLEGKKRWYGKYKEQILKYHKEHYQKNRESLLPKMREYSKKIRPLRTVYEREYRRNRELRDATYKLTQRLRTRARLAFTRRGLQKKISFSNLLGCSYEEARIYIEDKFLPGMSWANYGKWHIDHIKPIIKFDLTSMEQQKAAFHYTNLQPLWAFDNLKKGKKEETNV